MIENKEIPPFAVGQEVVCVRDRPSMKSGIIFPPVKKDFKYNILAVKWDHCAWVVDVGFKSSAKWDECCCGRECRFSNDDIYWLAASRFAPVLPDYQEITYEKIREQNPIIAN